MTISVPGLGPLTLNEFAAAIHQDQRDMGWYDEPREDGTLVALIHSEVSEMLEANRKGRQVDPGVDIEDLLNIENDESYKKAFESAVKDMEQDELADSIIRLLDYGASKGFKIEEHIIAKLRYNKLRGKKHGGKKF